MLWHYNRIFGRTLSSNVVFQKLQTNLIPTETFFREFKIKSSIAFAKIPQDIGNVNFSEIIHFLKIFQDFAKKCRRIETKIEFMQKRDYQKREIGSGIEQRENGIEPEKRSA